MLPGPETAPRRWRRALRRLAGLSLVCALGLGSAQSALAAEVHVVAKGQTLGRIAKRYHTTVEVLREVNAIPRGKPIHPGLKLVIPEKGKEAEAAKKAEQLRAGDAPSKDRAKGAATDKAATDKTSGSKASKRKPAKGEKAKSGDREATERPSSYARKPKKPGMVKLSRGTESLETRVLTRKGRLVTASLPKVSKMLRHTASSAKTPIDPRLATLIGIVSDHFGGRTLEVVSGFRPYSPKQYTPHSNHNTGKAVDFRVDGVPNTVLRDFCRTLRNVGVGYYPNSTFVHLDVRTVPTYWVDYSRPGERPRYAGSPKPRVDDEGPDDIEEGHDGASNGSPVTLQGDAQSVEDTTGNPDSREAKHPTVAETGQKRPTGAASSSETSGARADPFTP